MTGQGEWAAISVMARDKSQWATRKCADFAGRNSLLIRILLAAYVMLLACPIRYWSIENGPDRTWRFALNFAAANGYAPGRDYVYTTGPLAYLFFPQHNGANLQYALVFQSCLWLVLGAVIADVFLRSAFGIRNLALFTCFFSLAGSLFWFASFGPENLILAGALLLLIQFHLRGGWTRYGTALVFIGLLPLFKFSAALMGITALAGFWTERAIERRGTVARELPAALFIAALFIPVATAGGICLFLLPSKAAWSGLIRGSLEVMSGYTTAMSLAGPRLELVLAAEASAILIAALYLLTAESWAKARFYGLVLAGPYLFSLKHGFVRQDVHIVNFFCFIGLAMALMALTARLKGWSGRGMLVLLAFYALIWQETTFRIGPELAVTRSFGWDSVQMLAGLFPLNQLSKRLDSEIANFPEEERLDPELVTLIGNSPVASLSENFTNLAVAGLNISLYPTVQRFAAYTPYLDAWNASWIRDKGPRFLVFDGSAIDGRDSWTETPAMWLEIYRWYDTRKLGARNLLLERRATPRFDALETVAHARMALTGEVNLPQTSGQSSRPVFWSLKCGYSAVGSALKAVARTPGMGITVHERDGTTRTARVIPDLLVAPAMGNYLPTDLEEFAAVFQAEGEPGFSVDRIRLGGSGHVAYSNTCELTILRPVMMQPVLTPSQPYFKR
jgi:hypothetical protein